MDARTAIGVDLGATNITVSWVNSRGETEILPNTEGHATTPAIVYFDDERTIVGEEALLRGRNHPDRMAAHIKLELGRPWYHSTIGGVHLPPDVLQACLLRQLRECLDRKFSGDKVVTIAVPSMFNELQRRATLESAQLAGFTTCDIIDESIAATLAYAEKMPQAFVGDDKQTRRILVLNLGGLACEASVLSLDLHGVSTLATEADANLGGHDWDMCLARHVMKELPKSASGMLLEDPSFRFRLLELTEKAKLALFTRESTHLSLRVAQATYDINITRDNFNEATKELLGRVETTIRRALDAAQQNWDQLDGTLLVGGASQLQAIRDLLRERTGRLPESWICPTEAVARGAARHALREVYTPGTPALSAMGIKSLCTHSVGIEGVDPTTGKRIRKLLIRRGAPLPMSVTREFTTREPRQKAIVLSFLQGDSDDAHQCTLIGRAVLEDLPDDLTEDWPVDLTLNMGINGRITADVTVRYTKHVAHLVMQRPDCVSTTHFKHWQPVVESRGGLGTYVEAARREECINARLPVVIASSRPIDSEMVNGDVQEPAEQNRILSFLRRLMPFQWSASQTESSPIVASTSPEHGKLSAHRPPPILEVIEIPDTR